MICVWEQLTYTSADYFDSGSQTSGWHIRNRSAGLDDEQVEQLRAYIRSTLRLVTPLPGFPSEEQLASAETRLYLRQSPWGPVLTQTAQAGKDTTNRANTFTHMLLLAGKDAPRMLPAQAWRASWWLTPFGPAKVREAELPDPTLIGPGQCVTSASTRAWIMDGTHRDHIVVLVDHLARAWDARQTRSGPECAAPTVVFGVSSCDEAAQWLGIIGELCAPSTAWSFSWSGWEVPDVASDFERLRRDGLDLVMVPEERLSLVPTNGDFVTVSSSTATSSEPTTTWGMLTRSVLRDPDVFAQMRLLAEDACDSVPWKVVPSPAWMLSAVEVFDEGLLTCGDEALARRVTAELVATDPAILDADEDLAQDAAQRIAGTTGEGAALWAQTIESLPVGTTSNVLVDKVIQNYCLAASADPSFAFDRTPRSPQRRALVGQWLNSPEAHARMPLILDNFAEILPIQHRAGTGAPVVSLFAVDWMVREGVLEGCREGAYTRDEGASFVSELVNELAAFLHRTSCVGHAVMSAEDSAARSLLLTLEISPETKACLRNAMNECIGVGALMSLPFGCARDLLVWLEATADPSLVKLYAEAMLARAWDDPNPHTASAALESIALFPRGWRLAASVDKALSDHVTAETLVRAGASVVVGMPRTTSVALVREEPQDDSPLAGLVRQIAAEGFALDDCLRNFYLLWTYADHFAQVCTPLRPSRDSYATLSTLVEVAKAIERYALVSTEELLDYTWRFVRPAIVAILALHMIAGGRDTAWISSPLMEALVARVRSQRPAKVLDGISRKAGPEDPFVLPDLMYEVLRELAARESGMNGFVVGPVRSEDVTIYGAAEDEALMIALLRDLLANHSKEQIQELSQRLVSEGLPEAAVGGVLGKVEPRGRLMGLFRS